MQSANLGSGLTTERWTPLPDFEERYWISSFGNVYSARSDRLLRPTLAPNGYLFVSLNRATFRTVHRLVARAFVSGFQHGLYVNHLDGVKTNNSASNLEWCTPSRNNKHAYEIGLHKRRFAIGEDANNSKLNASAVHEIRKMIADRETQPAIAARFDVCVSTISKIARKKIWAHI